MCAKDNIQKGSQKSFPVLIPWALGSILQFSTVVVVVLVAVVVDGGGGGGLWFWFFFSVLWVCLFCFVFLWEVPSATPWLGGETDITSATLQPLPKGRRECWASVNASKSRVSKAVRIFRQPLCHNGSCSHTGYC